MLLLVIPPVVFATAVNIATELPLKFSDSNQVLSIERVDELTLEQINFNENLPTRFSENDMQTYSLAA